MKFTTLQPGTYQLPNDCKALVRAGKVFVCKKYANETRKCRECVHFGTGRAQYNGNPFMEVCLLKPKQNKTNYKKEIREQKRYYAAHPYATACENFKPQFKES